MIGGIVASILLQSTPDAVAPIGAATLESAGHRLTCAVGLVAGATPRSATTTLDTGFHSIHQPPSGSVRTIQGQAGNTTAVQVDLADNIGIEEAVLHFRSGGDSEFTSVPMAEQTPGVFRADVPGTQLNVRGVEYFVTVSDGDLTTRVPPEGTADLSVRGTFSFPNLVSEQFELAGVSFQADNADAEALFNELGSFDERVWRYGTFDTGTDSYEQPPAADDAVAGRGYWIIARNPVAMAALGTSTRLDRTFSISLQPGFNLIANPFAFPVPVDRLTLPAQLEPSFIGWNGTSYVTDVPTLQPFEGYWVFLRGSAQAALEIPPSENGGLAPVPAPASSGIAAGGKASPKDAALAPTPKSEIATANHWSIELVAEQGLQKDAVLFGMRDDAGSDLDSFDRQNPPPPPGNAFDLWFPIADHALRTDMHPTKAEGDVWSLSLTRGPESSRREPARLLVGARHGVWPSGWTLVLFDPRTLEMRPLIRPDGSLESVAVHGPVDLIAGSPEFVRAWKETQQHAALSDLTAPTVALRPNPVSRGTDVRIDLRVPESIDAELSVIDASGRRVRSLGPHALNRGIFDFAWDGRDDGGRPVAAGVYWLLMEGRGSDRTQASARIVVSP